MIICEKTCQIDLTNFFPSFVLEHFSDPDFDFNFENGDFGRISPKLWLENIVQVKKVKISGGNSEKLLRKNLSMRFDEFFQKLEFLRQKY